MNLLIGFAAIIFSALLAAALVGLPLFFNANLGDGALVIIIFGVLWFGFFFFSYSLQKKFARRLDLRRPCICLVNDLLTIPVSKTTTLRFKLDEPLGLKFGWFEVVARNHKGGNTHWFMTYALLSQGEHQVLMDAEYTAREAQAAGWLILTNRDVTPEHHLRLWAGDLVVLVEAIRAQTA